MKLRVPLSVVIALLCAASCPALSLEPCSTPVGSVAGVPGPLTLNGSARFVEGIVRLTDNAVSQNGSVFTSKPVDVSRFDTTFSFRLHGSEEHADGITFCIHNDSKGASALGSLGGYLGYGVSEWWDTPGISRSVAVEFDDYYNDTFSDLPTDHVGIDVLGSVVSKTQVATPVPLVGDVVNARVVYAGGMLSVYAWTGDYQPNVPFLQYEVDIPSVLGSHTGHVGFTSATATYAQYTDVPSWVFAGSHLLPAPAGKSPDQRPVKIH